MMRDMRSGRVCCVHTLAPCRTHLAVAIFQPRFSLANWSALSARATTVEPQLCSNVGLSVHVLCAKRRAVCLSARVSVHSQRRCVWGFVCVCLCVCARRSAAPPCAAPRRVPIVSLGMAQAARVGELLRRALRMTCRHRVCRGVELIECATGCLMAMSARL